MEIGKRIKAIRESKGLTQYYLAAKLAITQQTYSSSEQKSGDKKVFQIIRIAEVLEIDACLIFTLDIPINKETIKLKYRLA
jgi:transcriptional regulator with XRE-family HTH domain